MLRLVVLVAVIRCAAVEGVNIMLNKPSVLSNTLFDQFLFVSSYANDGGPYVAATDAQEDPYWEGDLQGFYIVEKIRITSGSGVWHFAEYLQLAFVGVADQNVNCSESVVTKCGQWPDEHRPDETLEFTCANVGPARYVRVWREGLGKIAIREIEVEGTPAEKLETKYDIVKSEKISTPTMSLTVSSAAVCATKCHLNQPCIAFSYNPLVNPNCLLASDITMTSDTTFLTYMVNTCFTVTNCNTN